MRNNNGFSLISWFFLILVAFGFYQMNRIIGPGSQSTVTVKGLAEIEVKADFVIWNIPVELFGNSLNSTNLQKENAIKEISFFLNEQGLTEQDFELSSFNVNSSYSNTDRFPFRGNLSFQVKTNKVDIVEQAYKKISSLYEKNIFLSTGNWYLEYHVLDIQKLKNELLEAAVKSAQEAAEKIATLSGAQVHSIKKADQGIIRILSNDRQENNTTLRKIARLVTTIEYNLKN